MNEPTTHPCSAVELTNEPPANSSSTNHLSRCQHRTLTGRRCRKDVSNAASALCSKHASLRPVRLEEPDLSVALLGQLSRLKSASDLNEVLCNLFRLLSQDRIAARRAAVLAYIANLLLRTLPAIEHEVYPEGKPGPEIIIDLPCFLNKHAKPQTENPTYQDLRS